MGRDIHVITWYDINEIKAELDNISAPSKKLDYLMKAKLEKKKYSVSIKVLNVGGQTQAELNDLIEYWRYKANHKDINHNVEEVGNEPLSQPSFCKEYLEENKNIKLESANIMKLAKSIYLSYRETYPNLTVRESSFRTTLQEIKAGRK